MKGMELIKRIGEKGLRVFSSDDIAVIAGELNIKKSYLPILLHHLLKKGFIRPLFRGVYALPNSLLSGPPLHEYEIISHLSSPSALCCWSAMAFHKITDQVIREFYILSPIKGRSKHTSKYNYTVEGKKFFVIRVKPKYFFGIEQAFINESSFYVTDLERTLIDGLMKPQYCGGFFEVLEAFSLAQDRIDVQKIVSYAALYGKSTCKRLGWVFEELDIFPEEKNYLKSIPCRSFYKLDVSKPPHGNAIRGWNLRGNF